MVPFPRNWILNVINSDLQPFRFEGEIVNGEPIVTVSYRAGQLVDISEGELVPLVSDEDNIQKILRELLKLINVPLPSENQHRVMYQGMPQSGKSKVQFVMLWYSTFVLKKGTIHLLMERMDSLLQNISRDYLELCNNIKDICRRLHIPDYENYLFDYRPFPKYAVKKLEKTEVKPGSDHTVYVAIANTTQLRRVKNLDIEMRQTVVLDEADIFIKEEGKPVMALIREITDSAENRYECTATPFSNFNEANQVYDSIIIMPPKNEYRGYNSDKIERHVVTEDQISDLKGILQEIFEKDTGNYKNITLLNIDSQTVKQNEIADKILADFPDQVVVKVINSKSSVKRPISDLMDQVVNSDDPRPVVLVSGLMASRAVTFRTSKGNPKQGILTGMVYAPAEHANQTTLMQAMRIFGNYGDDCPVIDVYWTSAVDEAIKASFVNNNVITRCIIPGKESRKCIEEVPVNIVDGRKFSNTDDSKFEKLEQMEFQSCRKLLNFMTNSFNKYSFSSEVITTSGLVCVPVSDFTFGDVTRSQQNEIKREILSGLERDFTDFLRDDQDHRSGHMHVAWSEDRYQQLFSVRNRSAHPHYKVTTFTCGNPSKVGTQRRMPVVIWKEGYENVDSWNDPNKIYIFQTTKGTWKVWLPRQMNRFRRIEH
jgi:hypothetical protein